MEEFNHEVNEIETEAKLFINQSFKRLRSAEGAFDMLIRFKNIRSREAINSEMMKKFTDILSQYVKECNVIFELFQRSKDAPPCYKNHPPTSGAIAWSRFLFKSIKRPILKFLTFGELMSSEQGKETTAHYLHIAKQMKAYEELRSEQWRLDTESIVPDLLKMNLLVKPKKASVDVSAFLPANKDPDTGRVVEIRYYLNYSPRINEIITEAKYLEQLGFTVPDIARNLALQEEKFARYTLHLRKMLDNYHLLLASLNEAETQLLEEHLLDLKRSIRPGSRRLNWTSLGIQDYINNSKSVLTHQFCCICFLGKSRE